METRSNQILVGGVVLALIVAVIIFIVWLSGVSGDDRKQYDIFFNQAVDGLAKGSAVSFQGVPVGQVESINLEPSRVDLIRVRISVRNETPILRGTFATIEGVGFTGVSQIQLDPPTPDPRRRSATPPPLVCPANNPEAACPYGVPVIPPRPGGIAALLSSAPRLLERVTSLTERLTLLLSDRNQNSIAAILEHVEEISGSIAERSPEIAAALAEARIAIRETSIAIAEVGQLADTADQMLSQEGRPLLNDLRGTVQEAQQTVRAAQGTLSEIESAVGDARPGLQAFSKQTVPEAGQLVRDLREVTQSLRAVTQRLDQGGATSILGPQKLPDYEPQD